MIWMPRRWTRSAVRCSRQRRGFRRARDCYVLVDCVVFVLGVPASISARNQSMAYSQAAAHKARTDPSTDFDAIIIGAGVSGLYQLYKLRELGLKARVFEAGTGVGGTWYWNRYPGARFDSESWTYSYSFSHEL